MMAFMKIDVPVLVGEFECRYNARWIELSRIRLDAIDIDNSNIQWSANTHTSGKLELDITQPDMMDAIKLGKKYKIYVVPIEEN